MTKEEAIQNIIDRIEEIKEECEYEYIGIRIQENEFTEGEIIIREATVIEVLA